MSLGNNLPLLDPSQILIQFKKSYQKIQSEDLNAEWESYDKPNQPNFELKLPEFKRGHSEPYSKAFFKELDNLIKSNKNSIRYFSQLFKHHIYIIFEDSSEFDEKDQLIDVCLTLIQTFCILADAPSTDINELQKFYENAQIFIYYYALKCDFYEARLIQEEKLANEIDMKQFSLSQRHLTDPRKIPSPTTKNSSFAASGRNLGSPLKTEYQSKMSTQHNVSTKINSKPQELAVSNSKHQMQNQTNSKAKTSTSSSRLQATISNSKTSSSINLQTHTPSSSTESPTTNSQTHSSKSVANKSEIESNATASKTNLQTSTSSINSKISSTKSSLTPTLTSAKSSATNQQANKSTVNSVTRTSTSTNPQIYTSGSTKLSTTNSQTHTSTLTNPQTHTSTSAVNQSKAQSNVPSISLKLQTSNSTSSPSASNTNYQSSPKASLTTKSIQSQLSNPSLNSISSSRLNSSRPQSRAGSSRGKLNIETVQSLKSEIDYISTLLESRPTKKHNCDHIVSEFKKFKSHAGEYIKSPEFESQCKKFLNNSNMMPYTNERLSLMKTCLSKILALIHT